VSVGSAIAGDWRYAELVVRQDATLDIDTSGTLFTKNQARLRYEGRYGLAVKRPAAFASVDLTAWRERHQHAAARTFTGTPPR
jgi:hypothetical protein